MQLDVLKKFLAEASTEEAVDRALGELRHMSKLPDDEARIDLLVAVLDVFMQDEYKLEHYYNSTDEALRSSIEQIDPQDIMSRLTDRVAVKNGEFVGTWVDALIDQIEKRK